jgi:AcrR family transcriptional regulator
MAAPAKTSDEAIVKAARRLLETKGTDFSMAAVAEAVGVQTPSLYKRFRDRDALAADVKRDILDALGRALETGAAGRTGVARLRALAHSYAEFARKRPRLYAFLFSTEGETAEVHAVRIAVVGPVIEALRPFAPGDELNAARTFTAYLHGFVTMEASGAFRMGGDIDASLEYGIELLLRAITNGKKGS